MFKNIIIFISIILYPTINIGQTVGVVLSGGGASGLAHVGFLKALEEKNIPIDYITGTSMGAIIASYYAAGYSVDEIETFVLSKEFVQMSTGEFDDKYKFYFKLQDDDASMVTIKHRKGQFINNSIPTKLINPVLMDIMLLEKLSQASAAANYNFDNLFIPYRCVASNIEDKESIVFSSGNLSFAARASSAYPFYLPPVKYKGKLLYDGGIYNNFPSDILYEEFLPDVILGNNVSGNVAPPDEDDLFSQLENMIRHKTNFDPICNEMLVINPKVDVGTFEFERVISAVNQGYASTMTRMDEILQMIQRKVSKEELQEKRNAFRLKQKPLIIEDIIIEGVDFAQKKYIRKIFGKKNESILFSEFKKRFFRIFSDDKIESVYPEMRINPATGKFIMTLKIKREKEFFISFGGNFSSRPINMGFVGLRYNFFGSNSSALIANSYFGKFYGSIYGAYRFDFSGKFPFSIQPEFTMNRWDYFRSFATFFEDVHPSFIVEKEQFGGVKFVFPVGNKGKLTFSPEYINLTNDYYQTENFSAADTSDRTVFEGGMHSIDYIRSTLNKKFFPNKGTDFSIKLKYNNGIETSMPGSTGVFTDTTANVREWFSGKFKYINYFEKTGKIQWGFHLEGYASNQPFFSNYKASILMAPTFAPISESKTFFIAKHRAYNYASGGLLGIWTITKNFDFRGEGYAFRPIGQIETDDFNQAHIDWESKYYFLGSASLIYHSPLGPVSFSSNYFDFKEDPWSFTFNFGYMIFNRSARD